ncbi:hypothetical protein D3C72_1260660 [compost metagenome]
MHGDGEDQAGDGDGEPFLADQVGQEAEPDDAEQGGAQKQQQPEGPGEAQGQDQLHPGLPRRVEIVVEVGDPAAACDGRNDQVVRDEQGGGAEGDDGEAQIGRAEIVRRLLGRIVPAQQGQDRGGDHAP